MKHYQDWAGIKVEWDEEVLEQKGVARLTKTTSSNGVVFYNVEIPYVYSVSRRDEQSAREIFSIVTAEQGQMLESSLRRLEEGNNY